MSEDQHQINLQLPGVRKHSDNERGLSNSASQRNMDVVNEEYGVN